MWKRITDHLTRSDPSHQYLYHVTPAANHDSILQNGLMARLNTMRSFTRAVYGFDSEEAARAFGERMQRRSLSESKRYPGAKFIPAEPNLASDWNVPLHIWRIDASHYPQRDDFWWREVEGPNPQAHMIPNESGSISSLDPPVQIIKPEHLKLISTIDTVAEDKNK